MIHRYRPIRLLVVATLVAGWLVTAAAAETARDAFVQAEACYRKLSSTPSAQKYRQSWMACIDKFQAVYRHAPDGPWAAAGLHMAGTLYAELYRHSGRTADLTEAVDHFEQVRSRFPSSRYAGRADKAIAAAKSLGAVASSARAAPLEDERLYQSAESCYAALRNSPQKQKIRSNWIACIDKYADLHQRSPTGPRAAAGLYMSGRLYGELHQWSQNRDDRQQASDRLQLVMTHYPQSEYGAKAQEVLRRISGTPAAADPRDDGARATGATPTPSGGTALVTGLRFWSSPQYTRLVIDTDRETGFDYNLLKKDPAADKPQRLYVDLHNSRLGQDLDKIIPINDDLLTHARAGQYSPDSVRVVVDIKSLGGYEVFSLKEPFRIVMDLKGGGSQSIGTSPQPVNRAMAKIDPKVSTGDIARQLSLGVRRIVIDPGHGGKDYGAPGYLKGVHEKHIVLQIAKRLAAKIEKELRCEVLLTRSNDRYLTLEERTAFANTRNADLFISIHTNANRNHKAYGISTYFLNLADDDEAKRVAAMENATSANNISDLEKILFSLMHYSKINESSRLATAVQESLTTHLGRRGYSQIKDKGVKQAPFYVLLGAQMPSILVETSFISNPRECQRLLDPKYQERLCEGIVQGVKKYIQDTHPTAFVDDRPAGGPRG
ncbi:MAG: N-acetylmuramoyl-L-alanine amidase [Deltaproteobacteria bacterium]|nr:N-acetylmuramoyl-L-alanine amidase [Deltaproteobacteria bacterium]